MNNHREKDQQFRAQMASSKEPVAEKWTELDRKAQEQKSEVERMGNPPAFSGRQKWS
ncbi:hypothetical protein XACLE20_1790016 [Xanthomonas citri pv. citri]|uniref:hypothetical protein n=1 Tax=Xanthomonas citri TaxID=346 RepID=UPI00052B9511|nr:hypothetical protein [Xanthomonas citri]CEE79098.1 hypothetical protein XACLE20_1790016 [Xanthomonas citri pv. citri]CEH60932.1 hypothetical protein XACLE3_9030016 [Xanthomonas citri pv. citri]